MANLKDVKFGVEIETIGFNNREVAMMASDFFCSPIESLGGFYDKFKCHGYTFMSDGSLRSHNGKSCEIVSPIMGYDDMHVLLALVNRLKERDVEVNSSCGLHVHVSHNEMNNVKTMLNLVNMVNARYDLLVKSSRLIATRQMWCRKVSENFLKDVNHVKNDMSMHDFSLYWYGQDNNGIDGCLGYHGKAYCSRWDEHYDGTRYTLCNLHSYFQGKGVEFRLFNSTLEVDEIKACIDISCGMLAKAINDNFSTYKTRHNDSNIARQMCDFLWSMGIRGKLKEFKTTREVFTSHFGLNPWK